MINNRKTTGYRKQILGSLLFLLLGIILFIALTPTTHILIQSTQNNRKPLTCVWNEDEFSLKWRHSVEKQYWQEDYQRQEQHLLLTHSYMQTFGAGTPSVGQPINAPDGYVGLASHLAFDELNWVVSSVMQGVILSNNHYLPIYQLVPEHTVVHISPITHPYIKWLFMESCNNDDNTNESRFNQ